MNKYILIITAVINLVVSILFFSSVFFIENIIPKVLIFVAGLIALGSSLLLFYGYRNLKKDN